MVGIGPQLSQFWLRQDFLGGAGLKDEGRFAVYDQDGKLLGKTNDGKFALSFKFGAAQQGVFCEVIDERS